MLQRQDGRALKQKNVVSRGQNWITLKQKSVVLQGQDGRALKQKNVVSRGQNGIALEWKSVVSLPASSS